MSDGKMQIIAGTLVVDGKIKMRDLDLMMLKEMPGIWDDILNSDILEKRLFKDGPVDAETAQKIINETEFILKRELASMDYYRELFKKWGQTTVEDLIEAENNPESAYNIIKRSLDK